MSRFSVQKGFTFIELLIVITVIGILAAIAVPSYKDSVRQARRADGKVEIMRLAQVQAQYRVTNTGYNGAAIANIDYYSFAIGNLSNATFTITATATGDQKNDAGCNVLTINQFSVIGPASC